ncbi:restriction endonuclease subunit S [Streptacidiphilus carbonis]|uniref:restriction endonuclease subunit S n=1 Tax=Streptacidiphilus carbonis TaxID=105422 RepID=UPI000A04D04C|nr:restriction endonuclease subunit S [Streptacidiphilus carbonis]
MSKFPLTKLGMAATIERIAIQPSEIDDTTPYIALENIQRGGKIINVESAGAAEIASAKFRFTDKQVLFGKLRPYLAKISRPTFSGVCSTDILPISPGPDLDKDYLCHFLSLPSTVALAASRSTGANLPRLAPKELASIEIPLPSIAEQRRIAQVLDSVDALRAKRREAIALLDDLAQSIFLDMFGDPAKNLKGWPMHPLGDLGSLDRGVSKHRPRNDPKLLGGDHPLIQTGDVASSHGYITDFTSTYSDFGLAQSRLWPTGTLCITIAANIAKTGILKFDACFPDSIVGFSADSSTAEYVQTWLSFLQKNLERMAPESAQKNINLAILRGLKIPHPGSVLIDRFAARLQEISALKGSQTASLGELDSLFASLQHRAFRGELWNAPVPSA